MRAVIWFCTLFALGPAGSAQACLPHSHAAAQVDRVANMQIAGGVWLPPRPLPGTLPHMPDFTWPLVGPHGGQLASSQGHGKAS